MKTKVTNTAATPASEAIRSKLKSRPMVEIKLSDPILKPVSDEQLQSLSRNQLILFARGEQQLRAQHEQISAELLQLLADKERLENEMKERLMMVEGMLCRLREAMFAPTSEKSAKPEPALTGENDNDGDVGKSSKGGKGGSQKGAKRKPSERYPNADIMVREIELEQPPLCDCCGHKMTDSGMTEDSEQLTVIPRSYLIIKERRHKYRCQCHGCIITAPALPRITPGGTYSDEMIIDATLSKFCDLVPMERYTAMAARGGFEGIPPQSLIGATIKYADFMSTAYDLIRKETLDNKVLRADETPHRMLEGDKKTHWYLWGFSSEYACFYECRDTRSGLVASHVLTASTCTVLLSDAYSGYFRAVRESNEARHEKGLPPLVMAFCNSHARREFKPHDKVAEARFMVECYREIYKLEDQARIDPDRKSELRVQMGPIFEAMKKHCETNRERFSEKSGVGKGMHYFLKYYEGLTRCVLDPDIPLDNNASERLLRSYVVGRKTWYGTHSRAGAQATAIHFTLIESCKMNGVNPRAYYREMTRRLHAKDESQPILTPRQFKIEMSKQAEKERAQPN